jgi:hypothetical protein
MNNNREDLVEIYKSFSDEEVVRLYSSGNLTELAKSVALNEIKFRHLPIPTVQSNSPNLVDVKLDNVVPLNSSMKVVASYLSPVEVDILQGLLEAQGVPAYPKYSGYSHPNILFPQDFQGCYISVPQEYIEQAATIIQDFKKGDFQLEEELLEEEDVQTESVKIETLKKGQFVREFSVEDYQRKHKEPKDAPYQASESYSFGFIILLLAGFVGLYVVFAVPNDQWTLTSFLNKVKIFNSKDFIMLFLFFSSCVLFKVSLEAYRKGYYEVIRKSEVYAKEGNVVYVKEEGYRYSRESDPVFFWMEVAGMFIIAMLICLYIFNYYFKVFNLQI